MALPLAEELGLPTDVIFNYAYFIASHAPHSCVATLSHPLRVPFPQKGAAAASDAAVQALIEREFGAADRVRLESYLADERLGHGFECSYRLYPSDPALTLHTIECCLRKGAVLVVVPLEFDFFRLDPSGRTADYVEGHGNLLVLDAKTREIERFEPNGFALVGEEERDAAVRRTLERHGLLGPERPWRYLPPRSFCPRVGPQYRVERQATAGRLTGTCAFFALLYLAVRVQSPELTRSEVVAALERLSPDQLYFSLLALRGDLLAGRPPDFRIGAISR